MNIAEFLKSSVLKNIYKRLLLSDVASTRSTGQSGFFTKYFFKILVSERKYKNNLKNFEPEKKIFYNSHIYVCVMFY